MLVSAELLQLLPESLAWIAAGLPLALGGVRSFIGGLFGGGKKKENKLERSRREFGGRLEDYYKKMGFYDPEAMTKRREGAEAAVDPRDYGEFEGKFGEGDYSYGAYQAPEDFSFKDFDWSWDGDKAKLLKDQETNFFDTDLLDSGKLGAAFDKTQTDLADVVGSNIRDYTAGTSDWAKGDQEFLANQRKYAAEDRDKFFGGQASELAGSGLLSSSAMQRAAGQAQKGYERSADEMGFGLYQGNKNLWGDFASQDKSHAMNLLGLGQQDYQQGIRSRMDQFSGDRDFARGSWEDDRDFARSNWESDRAFGYNQFTDDRDFARGSFESDRGHHQSQLDRWLASQEAAKKRQQELYDTDSDRAAKPYG